MDILNQIVTSMNKEEVRHFKLFTSRTDVDGERKDMHLFDYIRKTADAYDEEKVFSRLYDTDDKNAFYRLKNRLLSDINKSLVLQHLDDDDTLNIFHLLSLSRFFFNRSNFKVTLHYIRKAEKKAIRMENYELLDFIYSEFIKLSHEIISINPEEYIRKRKENREMLNSLREIDDILAAVIYRIKVSQNFSSARNPVFELLEKAVADFSRNPLVQENPKLRFTLYHAVSRVLLSHRDYKTLEDYLLVTYNSFLAENLFNKGNHDTKLQLLVYLINCLFKNRKFDQSLQYAEQLKTALEEYNRLHYKKYLFFYYNALVINYSGTDHRKAIPILEELIADHTFKDSPFYEFLLMSNLSVSYFFTDQYQKALRNLVRVFIHDGYQQASDTFKLRFGIFELFLRLEIDEFDLVEKRLEKVRKDFAEILADPESNIEQDLLRIVEMINKSPDYLNDVKLRRQVQNFIEVYRNSTARDNTYIDYDQWLTRKFKLPNEA